MTLWSKEIHWLIKSPAPTLWIWIYFQALSIQILSHFPLISTASTNVLYQYLSTESIHLISCLFYWWANWRTYSLPSCVAALTSPPTSLPSRPRSSSAGKISHRWPTTVTYSLELRGTGAVCHSSGWQRTWAQLQWALWNTESERAHLMCLMICKIAPLGVYLSSNQQENF